MELINKIKNGDKRSAARLISMIENNEKAAIDLLKTPWDLDSTSYTVGITGPPGAGKSTLTNQLAKHLLKKGYKVGIIAVDPSSPITGGAFLGDRIRMSELNQESGVFIRSMGTRGALGGISKAVRGAIRVMDLLGMDFVLVETAGVGQTEVDVVKVTDVVVVVSVPGLGDDIQANKAGILEIADIYVVNKADYDDAEKTVRYLRQTISLEEKENDPEEYRPEIIKTIALDDVGVDELVDAIFRYKQHAEQVYGRKQLLENKIRNELRQQILDRLTGGFERFDKEFDIISAATREIAAAKSDIFSQTTNILNEFYEWSMKNDK